MQFVYADIAISVRGCDVPFCAKLVLRSVLCPVKTKSIEQIFERGQFRIPSLRRSLIHFHIISWRTDTSILNPELLFLVVLNDKPASCKYT